MDRDELLARVDLEALLDSLSGAPADGRRRWHCPERSHPDVHPSVSVRVGTDGVQRWRCWSGGHGGTAIDAVIAAQGSDARAAIEWLADHYADLPATSRPSPPAVAEPGHPAVEVELFVERAARLLWTPAGAPQRDWLARRGLGEAVLRANLVGADPGRRVLPRPRGLPRGWPAVVYPSLDPDGHVTYLQARYLEPPPGRSKYDNPSAQLAANPRLTWTRPIGTVRADLVVVCEGTADALIAAQAGIRSVGVHGAASADRLVADAIATARNADPTLTRAQVAICFDADQSGRRGAARLTDLLSERGVPAILVFPPDGLDLTAWAAADPAWAAAFPQSAAIAEEISGRMATPAAFGPVDRGGNAAMSIGLEW